MFFVKFFFVFFRVQKSTFWAFCTLLNAQNTSKTRFYHVSSFLNSPEMILEKQKKNHFRGPEVDFWAFSGPKKSTFWAVCTLFNAQNTSKTRFYHVSSFLNSPEMILGKKNSFSGSKSRLLGLFWAQKVDFLGIFHTFKCSKHPKNTFLRRF